MNCDCGRPGKQVDGYINTEIKSNFPENFAIKYGCEKGGIIYNPIRICREGKWTERVPICGNYRILIIIIGRL
jgi:hypothetical protein